VAEIDLGKVVGAPGEPGTTDYNEMENKPRINGTVLDGDMTVEKLGFVMKMEGMGLSHNDYSDTDKEKLAGIAEGANNYEHPTSHPASMIEQDSTHRFVSDAKQAEWDAVYAQAVAYADLLIANLISGAPETLDTLGEIADAMRENADVVTALQEAIGKKANEVELSQVAFSGSYNDLADRPAALDGKDGVAAGFGTPTATIDANVGIPSVTVAASGPDTAKVFNFLFRNLKGDTGEQGDAGTRGSMIYWGTAITGTSTTAAVFSGSGISLALVNDLYLHTGTWNVYQCTTAGDASTAKWVYKGNIKGDTGAKGADGQANVIFATTAPTSLADGVICMVYE
jgi:hypothetical protein